MKKEMIDICRKVGNEIIKDYLYSKNIKGGINGPYDDPETKIRNLCHLIIIISIEIKTFNKIEYISVLKSAGEELLKERTKEGLFILREKVGKDISNGVIGHAWVIESLIYLYKILNKKIYIDVAENIAQKHFFNKKLGLWSAPRYLSNKANIDFTFNHQLWYAASLGELNNIINNKQFEEELKIYFFNIQRNLNIFESGRIAHTIYNRDKLREQVKQGIKKIINILNFRIGRPSLKYKEEGYQLFNILAFARLFNLYPKEKIWRSEIFKKILKYSVSHKLKDGLMSPNIHLDNSFKNKINAYEEKKINIYGYPYNAPGFEWAYIQVIFGENEVIKNFDENYYFDMQLELTFNIDKNKFEKCCHDKVVINYRIYELYRGVEAYFEKNN